MGWFDVFQGSHSDFHHKGSLTHDALAGAVAYEAAKAYEQHLAANGQPDSHAKAKEILAGLAGAALTRLVETKGLNAYDEYQQRQVMEKVQKHINSSFTEEVYTSYD